MKRRLIVSIFMFMTFMSFGQKYELKNRYPVYYSDTINLNYETAFNKVKTFVFKKGFHFDLLDIQSGIIQTAEIIQDDYAYENEDGTLSDQNKFLVTDHQYVTQLNFKKAISQPVREVPIIAIILLSKHNDQIIISRRLKIGLPKLNPLGFTVKSSGSFEKQLMNIFSN